MSRPLSATVTIMLLLAVGMCRNNVRAWVASQSFARRISSPIISIAAASSSSSTSSTATQSSSTDDDATTTTTTTTVHGRLSRQNLSLDIRAITQHTDVVLSHLQARRANSETIENAKSMINLMSERVSLIHERDTALQQRNQASALIGKLMAQKSKRDLTEQEQEELETAKDTSVQAGKSAEVVEAKLETIQTSMDNLLAGIPNLLDDRVPDGEDERDNEIVSEWGDPQQLPQILGWSDDFTPLWHDEIARRLGGYADEAAVAMSGSRFVALKHEVARLERAIASFFVDMHVENGYTEVSVPLVVSRSALEGTSQLPKFEEDLFRIANESHTCNGQDAFLIPTAEVPVTNLHRDSILEESELPISYVSWTPCFRAEAGSYGRDTKGLIRTHQFQKVELVKITTPESSDEQHELLTSHPEECLRSLELPYRKVRLCSGDTGFAARHCYDLEVWLPGAGEYREISSCSNTGDFQARRMSLRYRPEVKKTNNQKKKPKPQFCHTINGSGLAVGRTLVAILENYQKPDGSVMVPKVLQPYMGGKEYLVPPATDKTKDSA